MKNTDTSNEDVIFFFTARSTSRHFKPFFICNLFSCSIATGANESDNCSGLELELEQELELERRAGTQQCNFHQVLFKTGDNKVIVKNTSHSSELDT